MKKTLFLSAILGAALCSSFAAEQTVTLTGENPMGAIPAGLANGDTLTINVDAGVTNATWVPQVSNSVTGIVNVGANASLTVGNGATTAAQEAIFTRSGTQTVNLSAGSTLTSTASLSGWNTGAPTTTTINVGNGATWNINSANGDKCEYLAKTTINLSGGNIVLGDGISMRSERGNDTTNKITTSADATAMSTISGGAGIKYQNWDVSFEVNRGTFEFDSTNTADLLITTNLVKGNGNKSMSKTGNGVMAVSSRGNLDGGTFYVRAGTLRLVGTSNQTAVFKGTTVNVAAGATLELTGHDALGWSNTRTTAIRLNGSAGNVATLTNNDTGSQTAETDLYFNGNSLLNGTGKYMLFGGSITATGTNNTISNTLETRKDTNITVTNAADELTITGAINHNNGTSTLTKRGNGTLIIDNGAATSGNNQNVSVSAGVLKIQSGSITKGGTISVADGASLILAAGGGTSTVQQSYITVAGGGVLASQAVDSLGWSNTSSVLNTLTLAGSAAVEATEETEAVAAKNATWTLSSRQTVLGTKIVFNGNSIITAAASGATTGSDEPKIDYHSGAISVTGADNKVNVPLLLNGNMTVATGASADNTLTLMGTIDGNNKSITVTGSGHLNIGANMNNLTLAGDAVLVGTSRLTLTGTVTLGNLTNDLSGNTNHSYALVGGTALNIVGNIDVTKKSDGSANSNSNIGLTGDATITVKSGGSLTAGKVMNTSASTDNAHIVVEYGAALSSGETRTKSLTNAGEIVINGTADIGSLNNSGTLTISKQNLSVSSLTLGGGSVTLGTVADHNASLTTTGGLTVTETTVINADLVVSGGNITFANDTTLTMGCGVTIGEDGLVTVVLTQEMVDAVTSTGRYDLFTSVETATLGNHIVFTGADGVTLNPNGSYSLEWDGTTIYVAPEPATATLSMLALAALCARRKRR